MGKGDISNHYKKMSPEDKRTYNRWLKGNAIVGLILIAGLIAMVAIGGSHSAQSPTVANNKSLDVVASKQRAQR